MKSMVFGLILVVHGCKSFGQGGSNNHFGQGGSNNHFGQVVSNNHFRQGGSNNHFGHSGSNNHFGQGGSNNHCPLRDVYTICQSGRSGKRFMLEASCDPFNPSDPQCFVRLSDDPSRKCTFCCRQDGKSLQQCSRIR